MKKFFTSMLLMAAAASVSVSAESVSLPYSSDLGVNFGVASDWKNVNNGRRGSQGFSYDRDSDYSTPGTYGGVCHGYDAEYAANCWLFSPAFDLKADTEYVVSVWTKTKGSDDENFEICYGAEQDAASMTNTLLRKEGYMHPSDFELHEIEFSPAADGTYHVGLHCFSEANKYVLTFTGFKIYKKGEPDGPDVPDDPVEALALPFGSTFTQDNSLSNFSLGYGSDAGSKLNWKVNTNVNVAQFDTSYGVKENNWFITPLLNFDHSGEYAIVLTGIVDGTLDLMIGTDPKDISTFSSFAVINKRDDENYDHDYERIINFNVENPGEYAVAFRAAAEVGSFMGYRIRSIIIRHDLPTAGIVTGVIAKPDSNDGLSASISWKNPAVDHKGQPLASLTKLELYRNGTLVKDDFTQLTPGMKYTCTDVVPAAGYYSYHFLAYNENGKCDAVPVESATIYAGRPVAQLPLEIDPENPDQCSALTFADANEDGMTWEYFISDSYSWYNKLTVNIKEGASFDDYMISPYVHLAPGYYAFDYSVSGQRNSFSMGYLTDRHNPGDTFVAVDGVQEWNSYRSYEGHKVIVIEEEGDYAFAVHATGTPYDYYYNKVEIDYLKVYATLPVPAGVEDLRASDLETAAGYDITLSWINPTTDNAGRLLPSDEALVIEISRDGALVATLSGESYIPGAECSFVDKVPEIGQYEYSVMVSGPNGTSEDEPAEITVNACPVITFPYNTSDFSDWNNLGAGYNSWELNGSNHAVWEPEYAYAFQYTVYSPFMVLDPSKQYELTATLSGHYDHTMAATLVSNTKIDNYDATEHHHFTVIDEEQDHELKIYLQATRNAGLMAMANENDEDETPVVEVPEGKIVLGFRPGEMGKLTLKNFSLAERVTSDIESVAVNGVTLSGGILTLPEAAEIIVTDIAGRVLLRANAAELNLDNLSGKGLVIIKAQGYAAVKAAL